MAFKIWMSAAGHLPSVVIIILSCVTTVVRPLIINNVNSPCSISKDLSIADCHQANLTEPPQFLSELTECLNLSRNRIAILIPGYWIRYPKLRHLNMSSCGLRILRANSFSGLKLELLDLTNNPVLAYLPHDIFSRMTTLQSLFISGEVVPKPVLTSLKNIKELTLTFRDRPPQELAKMSNLKKLTFAFGSLLPSGGLLTADMMEPLSNSSIEELTFHNCQISKISHGSFDYFYRLKLINFACNSRLQISNVIDVLSTMKTSHPVENLILDNTQDTVTILGQQESKQCMSAWKNLKRLSLRNTNIYGFNVNFITRCLSSLESVAIGFNSPVFFNLDTARSFFGGEKALKWLLMHASTHLVSVDVSHLLTSKEHVARALSGCDRRQAWIPNSWQLFPTAPSSRAPNVTGPPLTDRWSAMIRSDDCSIVPLPRYLTYLGMQNVGKSLSLFSNKRRSCTVVLANSLQHLNMSGSNVFQSRRFLGSIYGLHFLETLDISSNGLIEFNFTELINFPSLRVLILKNNQLISSDLSVIDKRVELHTLDLSFNLLTSIPRSILTELTSLSVLLLRGNRLQNIDFVTRNLFTLSHLDIGQNQIRTMTKENMKCLDLLSDGMKAFIIDLDQNPLECSCRSMEFIRWVQLTSVNIRRRNALTCNDGKNSTLSHITDVDVSFFGCI